MPRKDPSPLRTCALCLEPAVLQRSHVIPEWFYKPLYDGKHQFTEVHSKPGLHPVTHQKGLRENLLCYHCEQQFSKYEDYGRRALYGGQGVTAHRKNDTLYLQHLDYKLFKLLQLSILWRASVSTITCFKDVKLGPHQEVLRRMLRTKEPGPSHKYGCVMLVPWHEGEVIEDLIVAPTSTTLDGITIWRFVFAGMIWLYMVSNCQPSKDMCDQFTQETGKAIMRYWNFMDIDFIAGAVEHYALLGKIP